MSVPHVMQSAVVAAPIDDVWGVISRLDFQWWAAVKAGMAPTPTAVGSEVTLQFNDGAAQKFRIVEFSVLKNSVSLELVDAAPAHFVMGTLHRIKVVPITVSNESLVMWETDFSSDATQEVVQDSKYKKIEALGNLAAAFKRQ